MDATVTPPPHHPLSPRKKIKHPQGTFLVDVPGHASFAVLHFAMFFSRILPGVSKHCMTSMLSSGRRKAFLIFSVPQYAVPRAGVLVSDFFLVMKKVKSHRAGAWTLTVAHVEAAPEGQAKLMLRLRRELYP